MRIILISIMCIFMQDNSLTDYIDKLLTRAYNSCYNDTAAVNELIELNIILE